MAANLTLNMESQITTEFLKNIVIEQVGEQYRQVINSTITSG